MSGSLPPWVPAFAGALCPHSDGTELLLRIHNKGRDIRDVAPLGNAAWACEGRTQPSTASLLSWI